MKDAEEYLSIINDPPTAAKLVVLIEELAGGATLEQAASKASLQSTELECLVSSLLKALKVVATRKKPDAPSSARRQSLDKVVAYADGASRGNPGEAACSAVLYDEEGNELLGRAEKLGVATNNVAEYRGVLLALEFARALGAKNIVLKLDSELVVNQLTGKFKVKNPNLLPLHQKAKTILSEFAQAKVVHISRQENSKADRLANAALDGAMQ